MCGRTDMLVTSCCSSPCILTCLSLLLLLLLVFQCFSCVGLKVKKQSAQTGAAPKATGKQQDSSIGHISGDHDDDDHSPQGQLSNHNDDSYQGGYEYDGYEAYKYPVDDSYYGYGYDNYGYEDSYGYGHDGKQGPGLICLPVHSRLQLRTVGNSVLMNVGFGLQVWAYSLFQMQQQA